MQTERHHELCFQFSSFSKLIFVTFLVFSCFLLYFWRLAVCVCCSHWPQGSSSGIRWGGNWQGVAGQAAWWRTEASGWCRDRLCCVPSWVTDWESPLAEHCPKGMKLASAKSHSLCFSSFHFSFCFWRELWDQARWEKHPWQCLFHVTFLFQVQKS